MSTLRSPRCDRQRSPAWHASDGVKIVEAFECFPVMTPDELALRTGIAGDEAACYLRMLAHLGLAGSDGENFWLDPVGDAFGQAIQ